MKDIQELFAEWIEPDEAMYYLSCLLGIMEYDDRWVNYRKAKSVFMTNNKVGNNLFAMLQKMVEAGLLEKDDEDYMFRWNKSFEAHWLKNSVREN